MTNTEAITKLTNIMHDDHYSWSPAILTAFGMAVDALRGLPSAQPEQRWIPREERLPEEGQLVLTTIRGTDVIRVEDGETFEDAIDRSRKIVRVSVGFIGSDGWYGVDGYPEIVAPCAWMPLPDPYKDDPCNGCGYLGESCVGEGCGKLAERKEGEA